MRAYGLVESGVSAFRKGSMDKVDIALTAASARHGGHTNHHARRVAIRKAARRTARNALRNNCDSW